MTILDRLHTPRPGGLSAMLLALLIIAPVTLAHASPPRPDLARWRLWSSWFRWCRRSLDVHPRRDRFHRRAGGRCLLRPRAEAVPGHSGVPGCCRT